MGVDARPGALGQAVGLGEGLRSKAHYYGKSRPCKQPPVWIFSDCCQREGDFCIPTRSSLSRLSPLPPISKVKKPLGVTCSIPFILQRKQRHSRKQGLLGVCGQAGARWEPWFMGSQPRAPHFALAG